MSTLTRIVTFFLFGVFLLLLGFAYQMLVSSGQPGPNFLYF